MGDQALEERALSLEEVRLQNIARNNDFLKTLFGSVAPGNGFGDALPIEVHTDRTDNLSSNNRATRMTDFDKSISRARKVVGDELPGRAYEASEIASYLRPGLCEAPAIVIVGTTGSGKSSLVNHLLSELRLPHMVVSCVGFTAAKPFVVSLWDQLKDNLRSYRSQLQEKYGVSIPFGLLTQRKVSKFADLALLTGTLLDRLLDACGLQLDPVEEHWYIVLDGLHHVCALDPGLAASLLTMSKHCHRRVKVIALSENAPPGSQLQHLVMHLAPYTVPQLTTIVQRKVAAQLRAALSESVVSELVSAITTRVASTGNQVDAKRSDSNSDSDSGHTAIAGLWSAFVSGPLSQAAVQSVTSSFHSVLNVALPMLMSTTTHPAVLVEASVACYAAMYGDSPAGLVVRITELYLKSCHLSIESLASSGEVDKVECGEDVVSPVGKKSTRSRGCTPGSTPPASQQSVDIGSQGRGSRTSRGSSRPQQVPALEMDTAHFAAVVAHFLPSATLDRVRGAVRVVHHLPSYSCSTTEVVSLARRKGVLLSRPPMEGGVTQVEPVRTRCDLEQLDSNAMRMESWCFYCPIRVRYLIVAAFLAGHNPKEYDSIKLVGLQQGKRKKQKQGTDKDADTAGGSSSARAGAGGTLVAPRYFSLERLLSIYSQLVGHVEGRRALGYGTVSIYATVKTLVEKGLLSESSTWSLERPQYQSCVTFDVADKLARLMRFDVQDYMHTKESSYSNSTL